MWRCALFTAVLSASLGLASSARADVISMEEDACGAKKEGDACELGGKDGTCVASTCSRNDYSDGPPPKTVQSPCLKCEPGKAPEPAGQGEDGKVGAPGGDEAPAKVPATAEQAPSEKRGGCSTGSVTTGSATLGFALFGLVLVTRRRRAT